jgi:hypothetical protein
VLEEKGEGKKFVGDMVKAAAKPRKASLHVATKAGTKKKSSGKTSK